MLFFLIRVAGERSIARSSLIRLEILLIRSNVCLSKKICILIAFRILTKTPDSNGNLAKSLR